MKPPCGLRFPPLGETSAEQCGVCCVVCVVRCVVCVACVFVPVCSTRAGGASYKTRTHHQGVVG